eukprot:1988967-Prymnesium_polylepis.1
MYTRTLEGASFKKLAIGVERTLSNPAYNSSVNFFELFRLPTRRSSRCWALICNARSEKAEVKEVDPMRWEWT